MSYMCVKISFCCGKKLACENSFESPPVGNPKSGVMGDGVCMLDESEEWLRTSCGVGGEPAEEES
jgi:hypothetical protein